MMTLTRLHQKHEHEEDNNDNGLRRLPASPFLPDDLVLQILAWLPVKSLLRFRCLSKSWKSFISESYFVKNHLHRSAMHPNFTCHRLLLFKKGSPWCFFIGTNASSCSVQSLFHSPSTVAVDAGNRLKRGNRIIGSCDGLLCFVNDKGYGHVHLWNPSLRLISKKSPFLSWWRERGDRYTSFGFGYDHLTDNYKVVAICLDANVKENSYITVVKVYTLGAKSWRQIQSFPYAPYAYQPMGIFVSGTLNWLATSNIKLIYPLEYEPSDKFKIVSLDLGEETYKEVLLPDLEKNCIGELGVLRDCLCFSYYFNGVGIIVWLMKEYGVKESWTKLETIPYLDNGFAGRIYPRPLFITESDDALLQTGYGKLVLYTSRGQIFTNPEVKTNEIWSWPLIYVESLVSPC